MAGERKGFFVEGVPTLLTPGEGEGVARPHADGGHVHIDVLAGPESPGAGNAESDADGVAGKSFDFGFGDAAAEIAANEGGESHCSFYGPAEDCGKEEGLLAHAVDVDPDHDHRDKGKQDVCV